MSPITRLSRRFSSDVNARPRMDSSQRRCSMGRSELRMKNSHSRSSGDMGLTPYGLEGAGQDLIGHFHQYELELLAQLFRDIFDVPFVLFGQDDGLDPGAMGGQD